MERMNPKGRFRRRNAVEVTNYLIDLRNNPNFKIDADGSGIAGLRDEASMPCFLVPGMPMQ